MQQPFPITILYGADYNLEQWPEATWLDDMRLMKLAHVNMVSINIFSWAMLEPQPDHFRFDQLDRIMDMLAEHEIAADLATATATPPTWMSRLYPEMLPVTRDGRRFSHGSRQHYCPNNADYRHKCAALVRRLAERYRTIRGLKCGMSITSTGIMYQAVIVTDAHRFSRLAKSPVSIAHKLNFAWGTTSGASTTTIGRISCRLVSRRQAIILGNRWTIIVLCPTLYLRVSW